MTTCNSDRPIFAANLDHMIRSRGIGNPWLGRQLGVSRQTVHQWRHGESSPSFAYRAILYGILQCAESDMTRSYCAVNLRRLMEQHGVTANDLADRLGISPDRIESYLDGTMVPSMTVISGMTDVFSCSERDIVNMPCMLSLSSWVKREGIPATRATSLFELNILSGAVTTPFGVMVPNDVYAPEDSKALVMSTKRSQKWGEGIKDCFIGNLHVLMTTYGISNAVLADMIGVQNGTISHWRTGIRTPDDANLARIAEVFKSTVDDLLTKRLPLPVDPLLRRVEDLEISQRSIAVLKSKKISDVGVLVKKSEDDLLRSKKIEEKILNEIKEALASLGLSLKQNQQKKPFIEPIDQTVSTGKLELEPIS